MPSNSESAQRPAPLACAQCRSRHLKCDGGRPMCRRCITERCECHYTPSRRGQRRRDRRQLSQAQGQEANVLPANDSPPVGQQLTGSQWIGSGNPCFAPLDPSPNSSSDQSGQAIDHESALTELYYANFHHSHPILVPKNAFHTLPFPESIRAVVRFIGSITSNTVTPCETYRNEAVLSLKQDLSWTPFRVQALLLYSIALQAINEPEEAQTFLARAVDLATLLGMNRRGFAAANSGRQMLIEESFRRTWWELFVIDGLQAALQQRKSFRCNTVELEVGLPCEDEMYASGDPLTPPCTLARFDGRIFDEDEPPFSSYSYRIEAVRIMARVIAIAEDADAHRDEFTAVDNALAGWRHHLPPCKAEIGPREGDGHVDELMFQAHLIINNATIMLHLPRSNLRSVHPLTNTATCCPWSTPLAPFNTAQCHLIQATVGSQGLSDLAALRCSQQHTPFLACGLIIGSLVQLSVCSLHSGNCMAQHRERVMVMIGVLKSLAKMWPLAKRGLGQVRAYAKEILQQRPMEAIAQPGTAEVPDLQQILADTSDNPAPIDNSWMHDLFQQPFGQPFGDVVPVDDNFASYDYLTPYGPAGS